MPFNKYGLYKPEDISFYNTSEITKTAKYFLKNGVYTKAPKNSREYKEFWDIEQDRILNGIDIPGKLIVTKDEHGNSEHSLQNIHVTGEHYGYLNFGRIWRVNKIDSPFSDIADVVKLSKRQRKSATKILTFPDFWDGDFHWFTAKGVAEYLGKNIIGTKARRKGFSFKEGFDSAITVNMNPYVTVLLTAYDFKYLNKGNQIFNMMRSYLDFFEKHTDFARGYLKRTAEEIMLGYKTSGSEIEEGYLSKCIALSFGNNVDAAVGKDAIKIKVEEIGKAPNLTEFLDVTISSTEAGAFTTGMITMFGTGGTKDANWEAAEKIFYNTDLYNCLAFENIWDDDGNEESSCGFFFPHILNLEPYIDEHGNSLKELAKEDSDKNREKIKKSAPDMLSYNIYIGQRANKPSESFLRTSENIFSSIELDEHVQYVLNNKLIKNLKRCGVLEYKKNQLVFIDNEVLRNKNLLNYVHEPILDFPIKTGIDTTGCYVEFQAPYKDPITGLIPNNLYRVWNDPFAFDKNKEVITQKDSLGATFVYERANNYTQTGGDVLIGMYVGRPSSLDEYNENLLKIVKYCNGICMFENDRGDVKPFFKRNKALHLLADEPDFNWKKELIAVKSGRDKGVSIGSNLQRKGAGAIYLKDWLYTVRGYDNNDKKKYNLHYIFDPATLKELQKWNLVGNFDRVSALIVGMFDNYELLDKELSIENNNQYKETTFFKRNNRYLRNVRST